MLDTNTFDDNPISKQSGMKYRIAFLTSHIFNPFLLCLGLIVLFSTKASTSISEAVKWSMISIGLGVLPVFLVIVYLLKSGKLGDFFIAAREQRTKVYIIACLSAGIGCLALFILDAPSTLVASFATGASTGIVFALINLWWKISLHTAIVAASATILILLYGWTVSWAIAMVPITAWARIELECHSIKQAVSGAVLAALIVLLLFQPMIKI